MNNTIKDLEFSEFEKLCNKIVENGENPSVKLIKYLPGMDPFETMDFANMCNDLSEETYSEFVEKYPDQIVDVEGRSKKIASNLWTISKQVTDNIYNQAVLDLEENPNNSKSLEVIEAKSLEKMRKFKPKLPYIATRDKFIKKTNMGELIGAERSLPAIVGDKQRSSKFLNKTLTYALSGKECKKLFLQHLFTRIRVCFEDTDCEDADTAAYKELINSIIDEQ